MKQFILFTFFNFFTLGLLTAQDVSVTPNPAFYSEEGLDLTDLFLDIENPADMINNSDATASFGWTRTILEGTPSAWLFPVCDNNTCYFSGVDAAPEEVILGAGALGDMKVHLQPKGVAGCGSVRIDITPWGSDEVLTSAIFEFRVNDPECLISSTEEIVLSKVKVYPNPTTDLFNISELENIQEVNEIAIYNIIGKKVRSFAPNSTYSVGDLPNGLYLVSLIDDETGIVKTIRLKKYSVQP